MSKPKRGTPGSARSPHAPAAAAHRLPLSHPAALTAMLVTAACVLTSVTYLLIDTDFWQHLLVGKAFWTQHAFPTRQLWTWPTYGAPDVNASWGFRALIWPLWSVGGVWGLQALRWATTLAVFALLWWTTRRMGATGLTPFVALVLCALAYRPRAQIRPEILVAVLIALEIWILETRRLGGPDRSPWIVAIAWAWANVHISYHLCFVLMGLYGIDSFLSAKRPKPIRPYAKAPTGPSTEPGSSAPSKAPKSAPAPRHYHLGWIALASLAIAFVNPFGWRALWQPFDYFLFWRLEPIFQLIEELGPLDWSFNLRNFLPVIVVGWPLLILWRMRRFGVDWVALLACAIFTTLTLTAVRFVGFYGLVAAPFFARDLDAWVQRRRWPRWTAHPWARAGLAAAACVGFSVPEWRRIDPPLGVGISYARFPVAACDFIAAHGIRGRGFNKFELGGYQTYRFWPDKSRLPFMDVHAAGTPSDRLLYARALTSPDAWRRLDARYRFDYALLDYPQSLADRIADFMDADTTWALVFIDDASRVYVRRSGPMRSVALRYGVEILTGGLNRTLQLMQTVHGDSLARDRLRRDLARQASYSTSNASIYNLSGFVEAMSDNDELALEHFQHAARINPRFPLVHQNLGLVELSAGRPNQALVELKKEWSLGYSSPGVAFRIGQVYQELGNLRQARSWYRRELKKNPGHAQALESLKTVERRLGQ